MSQEECPHLQQELRTTLFEGRGFDVYFQGYHFHSFSSTSWEVSSIQIHAWQGFSFVPLFEFPDKRHFMVFYLNFKVPYPKAFSKWGSRAPPISKLKNSSSQFHFLSGIVQHVVQDFHALTMLQHSFLER